ncbi:MAG TPA: hypothetical protein PKD85_21765, partial [Saprospiraceae bacterium]|nr:hypothetical protein [Saprospiraceae bacterium]
MIKSTTTQNLDNKQITIRNNADHIIYGGIYSNFYQRVNEIQTSANNPLSISKEFYKEIKTKSGDRLEKLSQESVLNPGDVVVSRIILKLDRDMDYLTLTDTR